MYKIILEKTREKIELGKPFCFIMAASYGRFYDEVPHVDSLQIYSMQPNSTDAFLLKFQKALKINPDAFRYELDNSKRYGAAPKWAVAMPARGGIRWITQKPINRCFGYQIRILRSRFTPRGFVLEAVF